MAVKTDRECNIVNEQHTCIACIFRQRLLQLYSVYYAFTAWTLYNGNQGESKRLEDEYVKNEGNVEL